MPLTSAKVCCRLPLISGIYINMQTPTTTFWDFGHELFKTTPGTSPVAFLAGDVFDPTFYHPESHLPNCPLLPVPLTSVPCHLSSHFRAMSLLYSRARFSTYSGRTNNWNSPDASRHYLRYQGLLYLVLTSGYGKRGHGHYGMLGCFAIHPKAGGISGRVRSSSNVLSRWKLDLTRWKG